MTREVRAVQIPEQYALTVLLPGTPSKAVWIEGRAGKLIAWIVQHKARVERVGIGALIFNLGLSSFTPELHEHFPRQMADREEIPGETSPLPTRG